ncbi:chemotaxis protein CheB [Candidatus Nitronereus thalassa]|uniref:protein-glutamate O-methyltransferase n=1 Tax=Candidatus Nitronereus thalassa TaxID=3020898 RepID=A0ABU3K8Q3_9BACT|nr:chemotaxis protein CheB [Candidatus Nitronereus thalassa]MDT7042792.1 chemotaxis protein CheB [Candidatus Nitronereus thalassa]
MPVNKELDHGFPMVGIGASAGGLEAFEEFFTQMPSDSGLAFIVVPHQHPGHASLLSSLLQKCTTMPVMEVVDGVTVKPNTVYLALAGKQLAILNGVLHLLEPASADRVPLPIDYFFRSLAEDQKHHAIGIVLSGTGSDGTLGLKAIKGESGMTMAQEPHSAKYEGMPTSAIATGNVDYVRPPQEMPQQLLSYVKGPYLTPVPSPIMPETETGQILQKIFVLLRDRTGNDFSLYKTNTIRRRIERRMNLHQIETPKQYLRYLMANAFELDALFQEILIGVTSFFRDPLAFDVLATHGLPLLLDSKRDGEHVRVWVPACGTGEEAYSLAMLIREYMTTRHIRLQVQIFGTDLDEPAIDMARKALYPAGIANDVTPERRQRFFSKEDHSFRIKKEIRDMVIFAPHNVLTDPPFTKLDLLSCRNLLIYLEARTQRRLFPLFHYALNPNGLLFLGSSETIADMEEHLFEVVDRKWKLYKRKAGETDRTTLQKFSVGKGKSTAELVSASEPFPVSPAPPLTDLIETMLLEEYAPASVIVNERGEIVYIHGRTGSYLEPAQGQPNLILLNMAREGLRYELAAALHQASRQEDAVVKEGVRVKTNGAYELVNVTVKRVEDPEALRGFLMVTFEPKAVTKPPASPKGTAKRKHTPDASVLQELHYTKQRLQQTNEELQTSNEELKSTNEELQSTNEELQSTNEELETSKEELQSLNEELVTVNAELQGKINELSDANDDLHNLLNSLEVATIFLDNDLNIKRFTPEAKKVVKVIPTDVGRPLEDIVQNLIDTKLIDDARHVLDTLVFQEREVQATDGQWYYLRILPYRTGKNTIEGLVLTFLNITQVKQSELVAQEAQEFAQSVIQAVRESLIILDGDLRVVSANQAFYRTFALTPPKVEQKLLYSLGQGEWDVPELRHLLEEVLPHNTAFQDFLMEQKFPGIGKRKLLLNARRIVQEPGKTPRILLAMEDITIRKA